MTLATYKLDDNSRPASIEISMSPARRDVEPTERETSSAERIARIRRDIALGTYETEEKLAAAVAALEKQIARQEAGAVEPVAKRPK